MIKALGSIALGLLCLAAAGWPAAWVAVPMLAGALVGTAWLLVWAGDAGYHRPLPRRPAPYCAAHRSEQPITARFEPEPAGIAVPGWPVRKPTVSRDGVGVDATKGHHV